MATRNHTQTPVETETEALDATFPPTDDDPEEFTADVPIGANGAATKASGTISLEELNASFQGRSTVESDYKLLNPPQGDWLKEDRWDYDVQTGAFCKEGDCKPGDINPKGRIYFTFRGVPKSRMVGDIEYQPEVSLRVSMDKRLNDPNDPKSMDSAYQRYVECAQTYMAIHGRAMPFLPSALIEFVTEDHFTITTWNGDRGPIVTKIKPTRAASKRTR
jgi:hypothetical protein